MGKSHSKHPYRRRSPEGACRNASDVIVTSPSDVMKQKCCDDVIGDVDSKLLSSRLIESVKLSYDKSAVASSCPQRTHFVSELPQNAATGCNVSKSTVNRLSTFSTISSSCSTTDDNNGSPNLKYLCRESSNAISRSGDRCLVTKDNNGSSNNEWALTLYNCDGQETVTDEDVSQLLQHLRSALSASISKPRNNSCRSPAGKGQVVRLRLTVSPPESVPDVPSPPFRSTVTSSRPRPSSLTVRPPVDCGDVPDVVLPAGRHGRSGGQHARSGSAGQPSGTQTLQPNNNTTTTTMPVNTENNVVENFSRLNDFGALSCRDGKTVGGKLAAGTAAGDDGEVEEVFDERSLAELVRRNMDLNVLTTSQYKSRNRNRCSYNPRDDMTSNGHTYKSPPHMLTSQLSAPYHVNSAKNFHMSPATENVTLPLPTLQPSDMPPFSDTRQHNHSANVRRCQKHLRVTSMPPLLTSSPVMPRSAEDRRRQLGIEKSWHKTIPELPETISMSHYYQRHRHRERDQCRAMRQVAEWIKDQVPDAAITAATPEIGESDVASVGPVQRHEHHHVHEHVHHHYHYCIGANKSAAAAAAADTDTADRPMMKDL